MPNGGVPMHMVLYPHGSNDFVFYCRGGTLQVFDRQEWESLKSQGQPRVSLSDSEGAALAWFLRYWLGEQRLKPGYNMRGEVAADFDF